MGVQQTLKIPPLISTKYFNIEENGYMFWYLLPLGGITTQYLLVWGFLKILVYWAGETVFYCAARADV